MILRPAKWHWIEDSSTTYNYYELRYIVAYVIHEPLKNQFNTCLQKYCGTRKAWLVYTSGFQSWEHGFLDKGGVDVVEIMAKVFLVIFGKIVSDFALIDRDLLGSKLLVDKYSQNLT